MEGIAHIACNFAGGKRVAGSGGAGLTECNSAGWQHAWPRVEGLLMLHVTKGAGLSALQVGNMYGWEWRRLLCMQQKGTVKMTSGVFQPLLAAPAAFSHPGAGGIVKFLSPLLGLTREQGKPLSCQTQLEIYSCGRF